VGTGAFYNVAVTDWIPFAPIGPIVAALR